jgi:biopolymer transport protein ExbB/TolQ
MAAVQNPAKTLNSSVPEQTGRQASDKDANQHIAWLMSQEQASDAGAHEYLLLFRFLLVNLLAFALVGAAYFQGLIDEIFIADRTHLTMVIVAVFVGGLAVCARKIWQTSKELNQVKDFDPLVKSKTSTYIAQLRGRPAESRAILASTLRLKLSQRAGIIRHVAGSLVLLGLIGTVIGFIIALSGVDPEQASDVSSVTPMVSTLIEGMSTALYTTLVGAVLNIWLLINYHLLAGGTVKLIASLVELGEEFGKA